MNIFCNDINKTLYKKLTEEIENKYKRKYLSQNHIKSITESTKNLFLKTMEIVDIKEENNRFKEKLIKKERNQ